MSQKWNRRPRYEGEVNNASFGTTKQGPDGRLPGEVNEYGNPMGSGASPQQPSASDQIQMDWAKRGKWGGKPDSTTSNPSAQQTPSSPAPPTAKPEPPQVRSSGDIAADMKSGKITQKEAIAALEAQHAATVAGQAPTVLTDPAQARGAARENPRSLGVNPPPVDRAAGADTSDDPANPNHGRQFPFSRQAQWASEQQAERAGVPGPQGPIGTIIPDTKVYNPRTGGVDTEHPDGQGGYTVTSSPGAGAAIEQRYGTRNPTGTIKYQNFDVGGERLMGSDKKGNLSPGTMTDGGMVKNAGGDMITDANGNAMNRQTGVVTPFKAPMKVTNPVLALSALGGNPFMPPQEALAIDAATKAAGDINGGNPSTPPAASPVTQGPGPTSSGRPDTPAAPAAPQKRSPEDEESIRKSTEAREGIKKFLRSQIPPG